MNPGPAVLGGLLASAAVVALVGATGWIRPVAARHPPPLRPARSSASLIAQDSAPMGRARTGRGAAPATAGGPPSVLVVVAAVLVAAVAVVVGVTTAAAVVAAVGIARVRAARRSARLAQRAIERAVPDLVDLFVIAAAAGHTVPGCLAMVAPRAPVPLRAALLGATTALARGSPLADVLHKLGHHLGVLGPTLTGVLASSAATGAPLGPGLADVAALARDRRRRDAENEIRRLPVTMLFPLVCCVLPAFVLLAVVPLLAAALSSLEI